MTKKLLMLLLVVTEIVSADEIKFEAETQILQKRLEEESARLTGLGGYSSLYGRSQEVNTEKVLENNPREKTISEQSEDVQARINTREEMLDSVDNLWDRPVVQQKESVGILSEEEDAMRSRLESITIPEVSFRSMPLSQVVEQLTRLSGEWSESGTPMNFVLIDPEKRNPTVSILLRRLNLQRILDFIVESVGYEYELQKEAVVIRRRQGPGYGLETAFYPISRSTLIRLTGIPSEETTRAEPDLDDPFHEPREENNIEGRSQTEIALKGFLQRAGVVFDGIEGADLALADGQLIVTQTARNHDRVRTLLRRYREIKQVEIEARFIEVQERNLEELGFEWSLAAGGKPTFDSEGNPILHSDGTPVLSGRDIIGNGPSRNLANAFTVGGDESRIVIDRPGFEMPDLGSGAPILPSTIDLASNAGNLANITGIIGNTDIGIIIRALERQSGNDLLSAPKVTVLSGKTAEIVVADEFRYPEMYGDTDAEVGRGDSSSGSAGVAITAGTPRDFSTRNVGVEMEVTPTVEEDNAISLRLKPKVTEFEGFVEYGGTSVAIASDTTVTVPSGFYQPIFSVRRVQTEVTIWDGATVVMGGLTREHAVRIKDKVPILGSIPLLGRLFRSEGESTQKRNLLIFVTANLVSPGGSPAFQRLPGVEPNALYQQEVIETPAGLKERKE